MTKSGELMGGIREGLAAIRRDVSHVVGQPPALPEILTPPSHALALDPDYPIVVGARGAGKSFWASVFADDVTRQAVAPFYPRLRLSDVVVRPGFVDQAISTAVSRDTLDELATDEAEARRLWPVLAIRVAEDIVADSTMDTLEQGVKKYAKSEAREARLRVLDQQLRARGKRLVIVFDALDRLSNDWTKLRQRTTSLLETLLALRAYRSLHFKLFMRPEQLESVPAGFTDLSKLKAGAFDLRWSTTDLYALAYAWLANASESKRAFANLLRLQRIAPPMVVKSKLTLSEELLRDPDAQQKVFVAIAGPYMGSDKRRGRTYPWLPKHLSDTKDRVTPRSFLMALGAAARHERSPLPKYALSIEGIKHGVSEASILQVDQLKDEYGWIDLALQPLAGQEVPCPSSEIFERWSEAGTLGEIRRQGATTGYLPPFAGDFRQDDASENLLAALREIGVVERRSDGRVNIPDLFRIAALMLRRGGPRPPRTR